MNSSTVERGKAGEAATPRCWVHSRMPQRPIGLLLSLPASVGNDGGLVWRSAGLARRAAPGYHVLCPSVLAFCLFVRGRPAVRRAAGARETQGSRVLSFFEGCFPYFAIRVFAAVGLCSVCLPLRAL